MEYAIETSGLTKKHGSTDALSNINIRVPYGSIYTLYGREDSGKTSLLKIIAGICHADSGELILYGKSDRQSMKRARATMNYLPTDSFYPYLTARDNLIYLAKIKGIRNAQSETDKVLDWLGIESGYETVKNYNISKLRRLTLAASLLGHPEIIILDEPFRGLDLERREELRDAITQVSRNEFTTVLITANVPVEFEEFGSHCGFLEKGKLLKEMSIPALKEALRTELVLRVDQPAQAVIAIEEQMGETHLLIDGAGKILIFDHLSDAEQISTILFDAGVKIYEFYLSSMTIGEYFVSLTNGGAHA